METDGIGQGYALDRQVIIAPQWDGNLPTNFAKEPEYPVIIAPQWDGNQKIVILMAKVG